MDDRRFENRRQAHEPVALTWTAGGAEQRGAATLRDLSRSGARVHLDRPVSLNTSVRAAIRETVVTAQVRSCVRSQGAYLIGLEFDPEFQGVIRTRPR